MFEQSFTIDSPTGARLLARREMADGRARGLVLVQHGLAEHSGRYGRFARALSQAGFHVYAHDHRGHGGTRAPDGAPRLFARDDGVQKVLIDCDAVRRVASEAHPGLPTIVFGHSMGGLVAANVARRRGSDLAGACIWNADLDADLAKRVGRLALKVERALKGSDVSSALMARATFETWGRSIAGRRTEADWLSHDEAEVDAYRADPACGWRPSVSMWDDVLSLVFEGAAGLAELPPGLPIHLLGGSEDPATAKGAAVRRLSERLHKAGSRDVTCLIAKGARHETLNEVERLRRLVMDSLLEWLARIAP